MPWCPHEPDTNPGDMNLAIFDIDGTLTESVDVDEVCFVQALSAAVEGAGQPVREIAGAAALLRLLSTHARWHVAIATVGWRMSARLKLAAAGLPVDVFPWANADDALDRADILRTAIGRAGKHYGQDNFEKVVYVG